MAGILAHEMGHLLARQQAISVSRLMKAAWLGEVTGNQRFRGKTGGPYAADVQREDAGRFEKLTREIRDARTMKTIWSRRFDKDAPQFFFDASAGQGDLVMEFDH